MAERNDYFKLCKDLDFKKGDQIKSAKESIESYAKGDRMKILQIKAEAEANDGNSFLSIMYSYFAALFTVGAFGVTAFQSRDGTFDFIWCLFFSILVIIICILWLYELGRTRKQRKWSIYFRIAAEDLLENKEYEIQEFTVDKKKSTNTNHQGSDGKVDNKGEL